MRVTVLNYEGGLFNRDLDAATDGASLITAGRSFHAWIVAGKKEFRNKLVLAR